MLVAPEQLVLYIFLGEKEMLEYSDWQGYKVSFDGDLFHICSPWQVRGVPVFGPDSDYTTLAVSLLDLMKSKDVLIDTLSSNGSHIDLQVLKVATGIEEISEDSEWKLFCHEFASLSISKKSEVTISKPSGLTEIDPDKYEQMNLAWETETALVNVSQGAYISSQQYSESLNSRLNLMAQFEDKAIWPPRQLNNDGSIIDEPEIKLKRTCLIESWTKLSAAGAPSEFSIRAPILDGISTAYVLFNEGTRGVFLLTDDEKSTPAIGLSGEIVIRRIYSQEGQMRYGTKVRILN